MITTEETDQVRITFDNETQQIYFEEIRCSICNQYFYSDDIVWIDDDKNASFANGKPFCTYCAPEEPM